MKKATQKKSLKIFEYSSEIRKKLGSSRLQKEISCNCIIPLKYFHSDMMCCTV